MKIEQYRDIQLMYLNKEDVLLFAGDSSASIGEKVHDHLQVSPEITGQMATRVVLMEVLSIGGQAVFLMNLVGNEMESTGRMLLKGIRKELEASGYIDLPINGSTEENMPTLMTSIGLMVVAKAPPEELRIKKVRSGHRAFQVGRPFVGEEVLANWNSLPSYDDMKWLHQFDVKDISEIVPIGSQGSGNEAEQVGKMNQLKFKLKPVTTYKDMSAGPATSLLVIGNGWIADELRHRFDFVEELGEYYA